jgi:hypothetical protein
VLMPSVVSTHSWNLLINLNAGVGKGVQASATVFRLRGSEAFALDPRLNPA